MCGRFTLTVDPTELRELLALGEVPAEVQPRYNIAPTQNVPVVTSAQDRNVQLFQWGLIPSWAKDPSMGGRMINARAETLAEKPSFRGSLKYKRCLILADGFYEWRTSPGGKVKTPYFIHMNDRRPFAFAGLWDSWNSPDGAQVKSCTIITTEPNDLMTLIHNRMPAILHPRDYGKWLDPSPQTPENLLPLIQPYPADKMNAYPVSTQVNKPENDNPELVVQVK